MKYFPQGLFTQAAFDAAEVGAQAVLEEALDEYRRNRWDVAYGASGTIGVAADILQAAGGREGLVTREGLAWLRRRLCAAHSAERVRLAGLKDDRRSVIGGGLSILRGLFALLDIDAMQAAQGALRRGVLHDLLDRDAGGGDLPAESVQRLAAKFSIDAA